MYAWFVEKVVECYSLLELAVVSCGYYLLEGFHCELFSGWDDEWERKGACRQKEKTSLLTSCEKKRLGCPL